MEAHAKPRSREGKGTKAVVGGQEVTPGDTNEVGGGMRLVLNFCYVHCCYPQWAVSSGGHP